MQNEHGLLTRRDFIRGTVGATLAVSVLGVPWTTTSEGAVRSSLVTVVRDKNVMDAASNRVASTWAMMLGRISMRK